MMFLRANQSTIEGHFLEFRGDLSPKHLDAVSGQFVDVYGAAQSSNPFSQDTWHHCCGIWEATNKRYVLLDGGSEGTNSTNIVPASLTHTTISSLAHSWARSFYFYGHIAEAAVYDISVWPGATSADKVTSFKAGVLPSLVKGASPALIPLGLIAYWPLIRSTDQDIVGGYHMTPFNNPTVGDHPPSVWYPVLEWGRQSESEGGVVTVTVTHTVTTTAVVVDPCL